MALINLKSNLADFRTEFSTKSVVPSKDNVLSSNTDFQITSLNQIYKKYNLQDESFQTSYIQHPLILRGIQRKDDQEPQRWGNGIGDDGLIRGGTATATERSIFDTERVTKWLSSPKGLLWITKQIGLGLSNPNVEKGLGSTISGIQQTKVHTGLASLLSVASTAFGSHFTRHGIPFSNKAASYENVINSRVSDFKTSENRLVKLTTSIISNKKLFITGDPTNTVEYLNSLTGPQSVYGIGSTPISVSSDSQNKTVTAIKLLGTSPTDTYATLAYDKIPNSRSKSRFNDYRKQIIEESANARVDINKIIGVSDDYTNNNIETKYGIPNISKVDRSKGEKFLVPSSKFGKSSGDRHIIVRNDSFAGDKINAVDFSKDAVSTNNLYPDNVKDFIEFYLSDADSTVDAVKSAIVFRATLTGLSDSFNPSWSKIDIMGRPDGAWLYSSYDRSISFTFMVAAQSRSEMIPIWRKLNYLASYTMPEYTGGAKPSGPFMRITIGNLFQQTPGFISSLTYTIPDDSPWDIAADDADAKQLPMYVEVSVSYTIVSDFRPQKYGRVYSLSPYGNNKQDATNWLSDSVDQSKTTN